MKYLMELKAFKKGIQNGLINHNWEKAKGNNKFKKVNIKNVHLNHKLIVNQLN